MVVHLQIGIKVTDIFGAGALRTMNFYQSADTHMMCWHIAAIANLYTPISEKIMKHICDNFRHLPKTGELPPRLNL